MYEIRSLVTDKVKSTHETYEEARKVWEQGNIKATIILDVYPKVSDQSNR
jgi:hypothetical protein